MANVKDYETIRKILSEEISDDAVRDMGKLHWALVAALGARDAQIEAFRKTLEECAAPLGFGHQIAAEFYRRMKLAGEALHRAAHPDREDGNG